MKYKTRGCITAIALSAALVISQLPAQEHSDDHRFGQKPKLIEFDPPGTGTVSSPVCAPSCGTQVFANNNLGVTVGSYTDANVVPHGFLRTSDGHILSFDAPGAGLGANLNQGTVALSINDLGVIAGQFEDPNNIFHGFVRYPDGSFTTFDAPGAGTGANQGTIAEAVNLAGTVAGWYLDENNVVHSFLRARDGAILSFDAPGAGTGPYQGTQVATNALNPEGAVVGGYADADYADHGFLRAPDGTLTTFDVPGGGTGPIQGTAAFKLNPARMITGPYVDASNVLHGYVRPPDGAFTKFDAPDAGTSPGQGTRPEGINQAGAVTGYYIDGGNLNHGFVWCPGNANDK